MTFYQQTASEQKKYRWNHVRLDPKNADGKSKWTDVHQRKKGSITFKKWV